MTGIPTPEEFVARARALSVKLRERSQESEEIRRMPDATVKDFIDAEFTRIMMPKRFGGCEYGWEVWSECLMEMARGSASQAWAMMVHCEYVQLLSACDPKLQDDIWGENPRNLISSSFQPVGKLEMVEGGYTLQTAGPVKWGFSSGIDEASWLLVGAIIPGKGWSFLFMPKSEVTVHDDWYVMGLKGSGSKSFTIDKPVFVPSYRTISDQELNDGKGPGVTADSPAISRWPRKAGFGTALAAVPLGAAFGMLDSFKEMARERVSGRDKTPADQALALTISECSAELDAAKRVLLGTARDHHEILKAGGTLTDQQRLEARRDAGFSTMMAQRASQRMMSAAGSAGLYKSSPIQRGFRDVHAGANHMGLSWEMAATGYGEHAMGQQAAMGSY